MVLVLQWQEMTVVVVYIYAIYDGGHFLPLKHKRHVRKVLAFQCIINCREKTARFSWCQYTLLLSPYSYSPWVLYTVPKEKVRVYSESFKENLIVRFWHNSAHKALGWTHLINRPIDVVLDNGLAPSGHALD